jgi:phytoene dehydrogenase-like protein
VVIGAGHNGLIAACYLARAGKRVLVLERREVVGGACVTEEPWPGYRVSTAAYLCSLLQPEIVRDLEMERYGFEVYRRETAGFSVYPDGSSLFLFPDSARTRASLEQFCVGTPTDVDAYFQFEEDVERAAAAVDDWIQTHPPADLEAIFAEHGVSHLYHPFVTGSVRDLLDARFQDVRLKAVLSTDGLIGTYGGPSTPGTAYVLLHHYLGKILGSRGAWGYVRGGMGRITQALAGYLRDRGGEIRTSAVVERILTEEGGTRATGVLLESGETISAGAVLSNADPHRTFARLLGMDAPDASWNRLVTQGGASAKINLAVSELPRYTCLGEASRSDRVGPEHLGTVHLSPSMDYLDRAWEEAKAGYPSSEPMVEIYLQSATDPSLVPEGRHILSLFTQYFPYNLAPGLDLDQERERFADRVVEIIGRYAPNVPGSILQRQILTPRDLEARFGLTGGHIFHGDLLPPTLGVGRPGGGVQGSRTPVEGLYLCGSGAHPGGCVFGQPGRLAAMEVLRGAPDLE